MDFLKTKSAAPVAQKRWTRRFLFLPAIVAILFCGWWMARDGFPYDKNGFLVSLPIGARMQDSALKKNLLDTRRRLLHGLGLSGTGSMQAGTYDDEVGTYTDLAMHFSGRKYYVDKRAFFTKVDFKIEKEIKGKEWCVAFEKAMAAKGLKLEYSPNGKRVIVRHTPSNSITR